MTQEKLQMIATATVEAKYKVRWLKWWNSSPSVRLDLRFPKSPASEDTLKKWLDRASFWAGLEEAVVQELAGYLALVGGLDSSIEVDSIEDYIENWRICLWDKAYQSSFNGSDAYGKSTVFSKFKDSDLIVKRLCLRYLKHILLTAGAIRKLPVCVQGWCNSSSSTNIFTMAQRRNYSREHLLQCCWYIECPKNFVPDSEAALKLVVNASEMSLDAAEVDVVDLADGDGEADIASEEQRSSEKKKRGVRTASAVSKMKDTSTPDSFSTETATRGAKKNTRSKALQGSSSAAIDSTTVSAMMISEAYSEPVQLLHSQVKKPTPPVLAQSVPLTKSPRALVINASVLEQRQLFREIRRFALSCKPAKIRSVRGRQSLLGAADLVIADLPEGLPVPNVSTPSSDVPPWNQMSEEFLPELFDFVDEILHDNGTLLLFFPYDNGEILDDIESYYTSFGFVAFKEWMGVNHLPMSSARVSSATTNRFNILLLHRVSRLEDNLDWTSSFSIHDVPELAAHGVDVAINDTLINFCTNPLLNGAKPWRGPREKDEFFLACLIMALTSVGDVIIDVAAGTGNSIRASKSAGRHIVALESDCNLFEAMLKPLQSPVLPVSMPPPVAPPAKKPKKAATIKRRREEEAKEFHTPSKNWRLPSYAESAARVAAALLSPSLQATPVPKYIPRVLKYMDVDAIVDFEFSVADIPSCATGMIHDRDLRYASSASNGLMYVDDEAMSE